MALFGLAVSSLRHNLGRTLLTVFSLAVSLFLFVSLVSVIVALDQMLAKIGQNAVIAVMHRGGFTHDMPESHAQRIKTVEGVLDALPFTYYGGTYGDVAGPQDTFPSMAIPSTDATRDLFGPDMIVADADWRAWMGNRSAALIGPQLVRKFGWKKGQQITLRGTLRRVDLSFEVVGTAAFFTDESNLILHRDYLEEALGRPGIASMFFVKARSVEDMPAVIRRIDDAMGSSTEPVKAMSQKQMISSFLGMLGNVRGIVGSLALLVMVAVFFVTLNSMALSGRERVPEIAVLKAIGFPGRAVFASMLFEGLVVGVLGGALGCTGAWAVFRAFPLELGFGPLGSFQTSPVVVAAGLGIGALMGMLAALPPALRASRLSVIEALRRRD